jgi:hypothetical protein
MHAANDALSAQLREAQGVVAQLQATGRAALEATPGGGARRREAERALKQLQQAHEVGGAVAGTGLGMHGPIGSGKAVPKGMVKPQHIRLRLRSPVNPLRPAPRPAPGGVRADPREGAAAGAPAAG